MRPAPRLLVAGTVLVTVALPGAWLTAAATGPTPAPALPELPSVAEKVDGLYDADGCLRTGTDPAEVDCSVRADELDAALSHGGPAEPRLLEGFTGTHWLGQVDGRGPRVLPDTVATGLGAAFVATGLARNEGTEVLASLDVTARLVDRSGATVDTVTVRSPVHDVRPGEPVPFTVSSPVPTSSIDHVEWAATGGDTGDAAHRAVSWTPYWERPVGGDPVDLYLYRDDGDARPYLLFGAVADVGGDGLDDPAVVVGRLSADGRLVSVLAAAAVGLDGSPTDHLDGDAAVDAMVIAPDDPPEGGETLVWVQGS